MHSRQVSIHLPRGEMLHRFGNVCTGGIGIDRNDPLFLSMRAVLAKIFTSDAAVTPQLGEAFLSLLGAYLSCVDHQTGVSERVGNAVLSKALALIDRHALEPGFGPQELARRLQVAPRTLQRHFNSIGDSERKRILAVRLETARTRLDSLEEGCGRDSIAAIAYDSGFNDLSYFHRAFRERFGDSPGALRKNVAL